VAEIAPAETRVLEVNQTERILILNLLSTQWDVANESHRGTAKEARMSATIPEIAEALVLRPGDKLLLRVFGFPDPEEIAHAQEVANQQWPDVPILVVAGDVQVSVIRPEGKLV
jgi:hypothetical protein